MPVIFRDDAEAETKTTPLPNQLVGDPVVAKEFGVSLMTLFRWSADPGLEFPPIVKIRGRNFRSRRQLEEFKENLIRKALMERRAEKAA
jgi:hypothetical protein